MALKLEGRRHADTSSGGPPSLPVSKFLPVCTGRQEPLGYLGETLFIELLGGDALGPRIDRVTHGN